MSTEAVKPCAACGGTRFEVLEVRSHAAELVDGQLVGLGSTSEVKQVFCTGCRALKDDLVGTDAGTSPLFNLD